MRRHKPKRKRKNLQCAKRVPNSIENEPTAKRARAKFFHSVARCSGMFQKPV